MYQRYFGMQEMPFSLAPDTQYYYCHRGQQEALNVLQVALAGGEGFIKITGEVGTGKTLLCRELLNRLGDKYYTAYIPNPFLSPTGLRRTLAEELGIKAIKLSEHELLKAINLRLIQLNEQGKKVVVCLDEAQAIPDQTLEALRLLSNFETEKHKLLQIVLFGQPELDEKLARKRNRQLRQRIVHSYTLPVLDSQRVESYLNHRLRVAGYNGDTLFSGDAVEYLFKVSGGVPRLINILCNKSLLLAFGRGSNKVGKPIVQIAAQDTEGLEVSPGLLANRLNIGAAICALIVMIGAIFIWSGVL